MNTVWQTVILASTNGSHLDNLNEEQVIPQVPHLQEEKKMAKLAIVSSQIGWLCVPLVKQWRHMEVGDCSK